MPAFPAHLSASFAARLSLATLFALALAGGWLSLGRGQLPRRNAPRAEAMPQPVGSAKADSLPPDLALYREIVADVHDGRGYYESARERIPAFDFPIQSPLNWRLPTYAWIFGCLPGPVWIQATLVCLSIFALGLAFVAESRVSSLGVAALVTFLLFGVVRWAIDGYAFLAQEPWAATLLLISISAHRLSLQPSTQYSVLSTQYLELHPQNSSYQSAIRNPQSAITWRSLSIAAALAALAFRELALPYCGIACLLALYRRRWWEAAAWTLGIAAFIGFFAWHVLQIKTQLAGTDAAASAGLAQWLRFGGLDFVLLTTRMNSLLFAAPSWLLWLYLLAALVGLAHRRDDASRLACLTSLAYLLVFAFLGRQENFYWGLMVAPLLPWGVVHASSALANLWQQARPQRAPEIARVRAS